MGQFGSTAGGGSDGLPQSFTLAPAYNDSIVWASHGQATVTIFHTCQTPGFFHCPIGKAGNQPIYGSPIGKPGNRPIYGLPVGKWDNQSIYGLPMGNAGNAAIYGLPIGNRENTARRLNANESQ